MYKKYCGVSVKLTGMCLCTFSVRLSCLRRGSGPCHQSIRSGSAGSCLKRTREAGLSSPSTCSSGTTRLVYSQPPSSPDDFFQWPFFLWAPYHNVALQRVTSVLAAHTSSPAVGCTRRCAGFWTLTAGTTWVQSTWSAGKHPTAGSHR